MLQGYKGQCEGLSMQLGQWEAEATALHLALQYRSVHPTHVVTGWEENGCPYRMALTHKERQGSCRKVLSPTMEINLRQF